MPQRPGEPEAGDGPTRCAELVGAIDWAATALGPYPGWPQRLQGYLAMVLEMPTPAIIFWGAELIQLYNDGYGIIMGPRHPRYFGAPYRACWPDTYPVIHPWMQRVLQGEVIRVENEHFLLTRHGFAEEAYFTFTFSPLRDDTGAIAGILQPVVEVTAQVLADRRQRTLRAIAPAAPGATAAGALVAGLGENRQDVAFALFYRQDEAALRLEASCGLDGPAPAVAPDLVAAAVRGRTARVGAVADLLAGGAHHGVWPEPTRDAYVVPVTRGGDEPPRGALVIGLSPRLRFDESYRAFLDAIARELAASLDAESARRAEVRLSELAEAARAEAELERARLHSVFMQAPVAITILSGPRYVVELGNPAVCRIWDRPAEQVVGRPVFEAIPELAGHGLEELLDQVRATGQAYVGTERPIQIRRAEDGTLAEHHVNFVYDPLRDATGEVQAVIVVAIDVTVHVRARQAAERLAAELDASRVDAEEARDAAQRANRSKDEFLAMLGHELRNPLAPIFTALELLRLRGSGGRELDVIARQARHLAGLVEDLLDVSRITSGKIELRRQRVELGDVVAKAIETASPLLEKHRHDLRVELEPALVVHGDPGRLTQVLANLLTNAAKYTDPGGRIVVVGERAGDQARLEVRDTGRGIAPAMLPHLFDLFVQEPQNLDRALGGLGLGLAIVRSLVAMHGGTVDAHSDGPGQGSRFRVHLPLARAEATGPAPATGAASGPGAPADAPAPASILIVDDNEDAAALLAEALVDAGYACTVAHDGPRALELAQRRRYDAVLLDIGLPAMDGYEVARHLRELPGWAAATLVAITGYGQPDDRARSRAAGFEHHLVKPVDLPVLTRLLDEALRTR